MCTINHDVIFACGIASRLPHNNVKNPSVQIFTVHGHCMETYRCIGAYKNQENFLYKQ